MDINNNDFSFTLFFIIIFVFNLVKFEKCCLGGHQGVSKPGKRFNLSCLLCPGSAHQPSPCRLCPKKPHLGGTQEASWSVSTSAGSFWCGGASALLWAPQECLISSLISKAKLRHPEAHFWHFYAKIFRSSPGASSYKWGYQCK